MKGYKWVREYPKTPSILPIYFAILSVFGVVMALLVWLGLRRKEN